MPDCLLVFLVDTNPCIARYQGQHTVPCPFPTVNKTSHTLQRLHFPPTPQKGNPGKFMNIGMSSNRFVMDLVSSSGSACAETLLCFQPSEFTAAICKLHGLALFLAVLCRQDLPPPSLVCTVGAWSVWPGASNVIPGKTTFSIDVRSSSDFVRLQIVKALQQEVLTPICTRCVRPTLYFGQNLWHCCSCLSKQLYCPKR